MKSIYWIFLIFFFPFNLFAQISSSELKSNFRVNFQNISNPTPLQKRNFSTQNTSYIQFLYSKNNFPSYMFDTDKYLLLCDTNKGLTYSYKNLNGGVPCYIYSSKIDSQVFALNIVARKDITNITIKYSPNYRIFLNKKKIKVGKKLKNLTFSKKKLCTSDFKDTKVVDDPTGDIFAGTSSYKCYKEPTETSILKNSELKNNPSFKVPVNKNIQKKESINSKKPLPDKEKILFNDDNKKPSPKKTKVVLFKSINPKQALNYAKNTKKSSQYQKKTIWFSRDKNLQNIYHL